MRQIHLHIYCNMFAWKYCILLVKLKYYMVIEVLRLCNLDNHDYITRLQCLSICRILCHQVGATYGTVNGYEHVMCSRAGGSDHLSTCSLSQAECFLWPSWGIFNTIKANIIFFSWLTLWPPVPHIFRFSFFIGTLSTTF